MASKIYSNDKTLFSRFGKKKDGTFTATVYMASFIGDDGHRYPEIGCNRSEGFSSKKDAEAWAKENMDSDD